MEVLWNTSFLIVLGSFLIIVADGLSWLRKPLDTQAPKGGSVTFHCEVNNLGDKSVIWTNATGSVLFSNSARFSAPMRYTVVGKYNLNISNIQESDNGQFVCNVQDFATETARLTVLLPPGPPVITRNVTGSSFTEGQTVAFVCKSTGGNPNPTITWLKNGQEIFNSDYTPSSTVGGVSSSQISPVLDRTDHKANYTCVVYNTINSNNKLTANQILSVRYSPHITFKDYNPLYVLLGRDASIICQVDANPSISSVTWIKEGKTLLGRQLTRYFRPTTKSDSGVYKCQASNGIGDIKDANIEVNVVYAPIITIPAKKTARELDRVQITCNIDANPKPYQFQWERVDGNQTMIRQNRNLVFNTIGRADAGKYACKAWSQIKVSGEEPTTIMEQKIIQVFVEYQPGNAFIKPVVDYNKGDRVVLKCEANPPGYPSADFEWKKGNSVLTETGGTLSIRSAQLSDNGEYTCTPVNSVGRGGQSSITLTVNEPPSMIENPPSEITQPLSNTETMTLTCRVKGRPTPTVQWFKDEDSVSVMTLYPDFYSVELTDETTDQYSSQIRSVLVFRGLGRKQTSNGFTALRVEDIGNYTCAVMSSAHAQMLRPRTQLSLQFKPRVSTHEDRVAVNIHEDAVLPCIALAFPAPSYQWYRNGQELQAGQGHYLTQTTQIGTAEYRSDLTILRVRDGDLGEYKCFATNFLGNVSQPIGLTVKTVPEAPRNLRYTGQTWDSVMLVWDEGFNGGYPQTFHVRYSVGEKIRNISVIPSSASKFNVTNLTPHTSYLFMVYSRNQKGDSALSKGIMTRTDDLRIPAIDTRPKYNSGTKELLVDLKMDTSYCLKIVVKTKSSDSKWEVFHPCMELLGEKAHQIMESGIEAMNVSVCLSYRHDVCGSPVQVVITNPSSPGLTERDVIIIASICAIIIVTLLIVLVCFICRRRRHAGKDYESEAAASQRPAPVNGSAPPPQKPSQTFDNAGMTPDDMDMPDSGGIFTTSHNTNNNSSSYGPLDLKQPGYNRGRHLQPNGHVTHDTSYDSQLEKRMYENEMNRRNENVSKGDMYSRPERPGDHHFHGTPRSPTKDKYIDLEEKKDPHIHPGHDMTPEPSKPKKFFQRPKLDDVTKDVYYSDLPTYSHDPPGHTCGLPCCREDLEVNIQSPPRSRRLCIPTPYKEKDDNFTFGRVITNLQNRKTLSKFRSLPHNGEQTVRKRPPIPMFNDDSAIGLRCPYSISCPELDDRNRQWNNISNRPICLPEVSEESRKIIFPDFPAGETDDDLSNLDELTLAFYATSPQIPIEAQLTCIEIVKPLQDTNLTKHSENVLIPDSFDNNKSRGSLTFHNKSRDWQTLDEFADDEHYYDVLRSSNTDYETTYDKCLELSPIHQTTELECLSQDVANNETVLSLAYKEGGSLEQSQEGITDNSVELSPIYTKMDELPPIIEVENEEEEDQEFYDDEDTEKLKINYVNTLVRRKLPKSALASPKRSPKPICRSLENYERYSTFPQRHKKNDVKPQGSQIPLQEIFPWGPSPCVIEIVSSEPWPLNAGQLDNVSDTSENYYEDIEFYPYKSETSYFGASPFRTFAHKDVVKSSGDYSTGEISEAFKNSPITLIL